MRRIAWALGALLLAACATPSARRDVPQAVPQFQVDPFWPKPRPNNWIMGQIGGLAAGESDDGKRVQKFRRVNGPPT